MFPPAFHNLITARRGLAFHPSGGLSLDAPNLPVHSNTRLILDGQAAGRYQDDLVA